jgi:hypothetical protein
VHAIVSDHALLLLLLLLCRFKGVAGVHSIVSVTSEELGGRTFPTTIRRGKGEQVRLGRGLLALVQVRLHGSFRCWILTGCHPWGGGQVWIVAVSRCSKDSECDRREDDSKLAGGQGGAGQAGTRPAGAGAGEAVWLCHNVFVTF